MFCDRRILAVVPARGGSKGIPLKNLQHVLGSSLVAKVGEVIQQLACIDRSVVSTDHAEIARIAQEAGISAPFLRPPELSGDLVGDWDVLSHALGTLESIDGIEYDLVIMLQPTSPMRRSEHVEGAIRFLIDNQYDSVWTVSKIDPKYHPLKLLRVENGLMNYYDPEGSKIIARQQLGDLYCRNGIAYVLTRDCILRQRSTKGAKSGAYVVVGNAISIDTFEDIKLVEYYLSQNSAM